MYFITTKRMLEVCFSAHPNIQYRTQKKAPQNLFSHLFCGALSGRPQGPPYIKL